MTPVPLPCQRALFSIPRDVAYFNCAYMSPLMRSAEAAGVAGLGRKRTPWTIRATDFFEGTEEARGLFARLIGATADGVAVVPSVSYGMAVAARNVPISRGQTVVIAAEEFPSCVFVWRAVAERAGAEMVIVPRPEDGDWTTALLGAVDSRTAVVVACETHWVCGGRVDLPSLGARCREVGAALVLDLTQSAGVLPVDVAAIDPDFLVAACYKWLLGPYSLGFLYAAPRWWEGAPLEEGWSVRAGAEDFRGLIDYKVAFRPGARRYDMGEHSNFALLPVAASALRQILDWGPERISASLGRLADALVVAAAPLGAVASPSTVRSPHYLALGFPGGLSDDVPARLAERGVHASARGPRLRVTPHLYNDEADIDRFADALRAVMRS